jgi:hypothetical protein
VGVFAAEVWVFAEGYFVVEGVFGGMCFLGWNCGDRRKLEGFARVFSGDGVF